MFDTAAIAKKIKQARIEKNMTQLNLADAMGVSYQAVSNWERGNSMPDISKLGDLCATLGLTVNELLGVEEKAAVSKVLDREELTVEELVEVAPMLKPEEVKAQVEEKRSWIGPDMSFLESGMDALKQEKPAEESSEPEKKKSTGKVKVFVNGVEVKFSKGEKKRQKKKMDLEAIAELAPYLEESYLEEIALEAAEKSLEGIEELAGSLSEELLDKVVERAPDRELPELLEAASYLSDRSLEALVRRMDEDHLDELAEIACYLNEKTLNLLVQRCREADAYDVIADIGCYLDGQTLESLVDQLIAEEFDPEELDEIEELYCYMGESALKKLARYYMGRRDLDAMEEITGYM